MSADNWTECPRCIARKERRNADLTQQVKDAYGSMPLEEWLNLRDMTLRDIDEKVDQTFREDWEIGVFNGEFFVQYKGFCGTCDLRYEFTYDQPIKVDES